MNHKRGKPKNSRAGCLMCKPWKGNGMERKAGYRTLQETKARISEAEQVQEISL